jgi:hypothetical protein
MISSEVIVAWSDAGKASASADTLMAVAASSRLAL